MVAGRHGVEETDGLQVFGRHAEGHRVADGLVEPVVGALLEEDGERDVSLEVKVVAELVVDGDEVFFRRLDAHLDSQIAAPRDVPRAGVAHDLPVPRADEERALPEVFGSGSSPSAQKKCSP